MEVTVGTPESQLMELYLTPVTTKLVKWFGTAVRKVLSCLDHRRELVQRMEPGQTVCLYVDLMWLWDSLLYSQKLCGVMNQVWPLMGIWTLAVSLQELQNRDGGR